MRQQKNIQPSRFRRYLIPVLLGISCMLHLSKVSAQVFAVNAATQLSPPYSVYLPDYASPGNEKLRVILILRDLTQPVYQVRLRMSISLNGKEIMRSSPLYNPAPVSIYPGTPVVVSGADLAPYLDSRNIDFSGYSREQYERNKALPEGSYQICFTAFDYNRKDVQLSNTGCSFYFLYKHEPPFIILPADKSNVLALQPQLVNFSWITRNVVPPGIGGMSDIEYRFSLYENQNKVDPNFLVQSIKPIYTTSTSQKNLIYGMAEPPLTEGMQYAVRIQAVDKSGKDAFQNNGFSQVISFVYGQLKPGERPLPAITDFRAAAAGERAGRMWWTPPFDAGFDSYRLQYKKAGRGWEWFEKIVTGTDAKAFDLEPDVSYETRLQGIKDGRYGAFSDIAVFRTDKPRVFACGDELPYLRYEQLRPLDAAIPGMIWKVGQFDMQINEVNGGNGTFSGKGSITVPYIGMNLNVRFDNVEVNENRVLYRGEVIALSKPLKQYIEEQLEQQKERTVERQQKANREKYKDLELFAFTLSFKDYDIEGVAYDKVTQEIIITHDGGKVERRKIKPEEGDKDLLVQGKGKDQWVVKKDGTVEKVTGGGLYPGMNTIVDKEVEDLLKKALAALNREMTAEHIASLKAEMKAGESKLDQLLAKPENKDAARMHFIIVSRATISASSAGISGKTEDAAANLEYKRSEYKYNTAIVTRMITSERNTKEVIRMLALELKPEGQPVTQWIRSARQRQEGDDTIISRLKPLIILHIEGIVTKYIYK
ncbi:fibronectin type III domain-containing protein [Chitinophaga solisilvae]|uniref:fibronectin type III domain-containing protein n=1 Tax=Chitinophaga solisilvae TaxID=1233460 RepID=UPI0013696707|nr:fibronectin type III domain-containing protein [Chitinophaga solisilvae]